MMRGMRLDLRYEWKDSTEGEYEASAKPTPKVKALAIMAIHAPELESNQSNRLKTRRCGVF